MSTIENTHQISLVQAILWVVGYLGVMLLFTALDMGVWRKIDNLYSRWLSLATKVLLAVLFLQLLTSSTGFKLNVFRNITLKGIAYALICAMLFYFLLDKFLDPFFEGLFPKSEQGYRDSLKTLAKNPVVSFLFVCVFTPIIEELLIRDFVLGGLIGTVSKYGALLISAVIFALLHFNMVQTISALICGLILGVLYLETNSIFCCILAHFGYNTISYFTTVYPLVRQ